MNESTQLLSTMSPRVKVKNNFSRKGPTFLALPQSLKRRSSNAFKRATRPAKKDPLIIESSTESDNSCSPAVERTNKIKDIERWLNDVEAVAEDFNELSTILGDSDCLPKERGEAVNSTFARDKYKKINEFFTPKRPVRRLNDSDIISDSDKSDESLENVKLSKCSRNKTERDGKRNISTSPEDKNNASSSERNRFAGSLYLNKSKSIDDIIDISSTSEEKPIDELLEGIDSNEPPKNLGGNDLSTNSNNKSVKADSNKSKCLDDNDVISITSSSEEESIDRLFKNLDLNKPSNRLDVSTVSRNVTARKKFPRGGEFVTSISADDKENGKLWKSNSSSTTLRKASGKAEPRPRNVTKKTNDTHSEKRSETSPLYTNPYLDRDEPKWNSLRQNLFKTTTKSVRENSFVERIKKLCDSDMDSESANSDDTDPDKDDMYSVESSDEIITKSVEGKSCSATLSKAVGPISPKTEPRPHLLRKPRDTYSEKQSKTSLLYKEPCVYRDEMTSSSLRQNLFKTKIKLVEEYSPVEGIKKGCDSESDYRSVNSGSEPDRDDVFSAKESPDGEYTKPVQGDALDLSELESILDEAYGDTWKKNKDRILPRTEPRPRNNHRLPKDPICSERKLETSEAARGPFMQDIRKTLFKSSVGLVRDKRYTFLESLSASVPIEECDPSARIFRTNFKTHRDELRQKLHDLYNEKVFGNKLTNISYKWSNKYLHTAGVCRYKRSRQESVATIILAEKVIDSPERLRNTLIHEMCHAATWIIDKVICTHGKFWKAWTFRAMRAFKELPPIERCHSYDINYKYTYKCEDCGYRIGRYTKSIDVEKQCCNRCCGRYEVFINKKNKKGEVESVPIPSTPKKPLTPFASYVKEHYATLRSPGVPHTEVMRTLGIKFREKKVNK